MSYAPCLVNSGPNGEVHLTRRRGDAEEDAEKRQTGQNLRTRRKRRDVGWRHRNYAHAGAYFGVRPGLSARAFRRRRLISAVSAVLRRVRRVAESGGARLAKDLTYFALVVASLPFVAAEAACGAGATVMIEARPK